MRHCHTSITWYVCCIHIHWDTNDNALVSVGAIFHPFPMCKLPSIPLNGRFLRLCKQGTLQFVIIKPLTAVLSLIMLAAGVYDHIIYQWFLFVVYNISYSWVSYLVT
jgi:hypothetical protein